MNRNHIPAHLCIAHLVRMTCTCGRCCAGFVTSMYGCRCKRSDRPSTKLSERVWFCLLFLSVLLTFCNMYLWLVTTNEAKMFDLGFWNKYQWDYDFHFMFHTASLVLFGYPFILLLFALLHMIMKERLHLNVIHKIFLIVIDFITVAILVLSIVNTRFLWHFIQLSLMFFGPFLHLLAVVLMTLVTWFVAGALGTLQKKGTVVRDFSVWYFLLMLGLYLCPLLIRSPCIIEDADLIEKPRLFAHKGAEHIAPENTMAAFNRALTECEVYGIESDVRISVDGVHVCMHDKTLARTTNVKDIFSDRVDTPTEHFTSEELSLLDAGSWFLERDPFGTVSELTENQRELYKQQKIPKLSELISLVMAHKVNILFDLMPPPEGHPYEKNFVDHTMETLKELGVSDSSVHITKAPNGPHYIIFVNNIDRRVLVNEYNAISFQTIRENKESGISTNVWTVNKKWVYSLFWCGGAFSVTTSHCRDLRDIAEPSWQLTYTHYLIMWIMYDIVSFMWVLIIFVCQIRSKRKRDPMPRDEGVIQETRIQ